MSFAKRRQKLPMNFKIQITSMVDMFVILLVFLIKSYSTSPVLISPSADIRLPASESQTNPVDVLKLIVSKSGVFVEGQKVIDLADGQINKKDIDNSDSNYIPELFKYLDAEARKTLEIAKINSTITFEGKILVQADKDLTYDLLQKVMHTSAVAGYSDVKFAVISNE